MSKQHAWQDCQSCSTRSVGTVLSPPPSGRRGTAATISRGLLCPWARGDWEARRSSMAAPADGPHGEQGPGWEPAAKEGGRGRRRGGGRRRVGKRASHGRQRDDHGLARCAYLYKAGGASRPVRQLAEALALTPRSQQACMARRWQRWLLRRHLIELPSLLGERGYWRRCRRCAAAAAAPAVGAERIRRGCALTQEVLL